jgi:octaheme c-type cytochrome (tetrathionate reductase family)
MRAKRSSALRLASLVSIVLLAFGVAGCEDGKDGADGMDGAAGTDGAPGADGSDGSDGINCWDLNANGVGDPEEDLNGDGVVDVQDCNALAGGAYETAQLHVGYFTEHNYEGTQSCLNCHGKIGDNVMTTAHFKWEGTSTNIEGFEGEDGNGKNNLINNFCIAVPSNEGRCTHCHTGYGYDDNTFAFNDPETVDCLICHDQSGTYKKQLTAAGAPDPAVDLNIVARSVALNDGVPSRQGCTFCHANAGGGDNVKHGDIAMALLDTTRDFDVHMGTDGGDFACIDCHRLKKDANGKLIDHGIGGMAYHSVDEGDMQGCVDCHGDRANIHVNSTVEGIIGMGAHDALACQVCHIPAIARNTSTKVEWYWEDAGKDLVAEKTGMPPRDNWDKKKGSFVWANDVRPELLYFDGKWNRMLIGRNDQYTSLPVDLGSPSANYATPGAMIYPFKKMIGNQPADAGNQTMLVPHLYGGKGGPNAFWGNYDWDLALADGALYNNQEYTGDYEFVDTFMYLKVDHEVAPAEQAYGMDGACGDCHTGDQIDWQALGWDADPITGTANRIPVP